MAIHIQHSNGKSWIEIQGEMTIFVAQELRDSLSPILQESNDIEIDLSQVTEFDGAGLQLMLATKLSANQAGAELHFVKHSEVVQEVLDLTDTVGFFGDPVVMDSHQA